MHVVRVVEQRRGRFNEIITALGLSDRSVARGGGRQRVDGAREVGGCGVEVIRAIWLMG